MGGATKPISNTTDRLREIEYSKEKTKACTKRCYLKKKEIPHVKQQKKKKIFKTRKWSKIYRKQKKPKTLRRD